jgi:hypothetical protein
LEAISHLQEGGKRTPPPKLTTNGGVLLVEAAEDVEDKRAVGDVLAEVAKSVSHLLEPYAVVVMDRSPWTKLRN